jgi:hypothetical protein
MKSYSMKFILEILHLIKVPEIQKFSRLYFLFIYPWLNRVTKTEQENIVLDFFRTFLRQKKLKQLIGPYFLKKGPFWRNATKVFFSDFSIVPKVFFSYSASKTEQETQLWHSTSMTPSKHFFRRARCGRLFSSESCKPI